MRNSRLFRFFRWVMASTYLSRASLFSIVSLALTTIWSVTAHSESSSTRRVSESIASRFTTTIPLQQCQYPRFWPHGDSAIRDITFTAGGHDLPRESFDANFSHSFSALREVPSGLTTHEGSLSPRPPSEQTSELFRRITKHFVEQGYTVPETLVVIDSRAPNAFVRHGREVVMTSAMARQVTEPSEVAFILAHEVAHVALGHRLQGGISAEVAADSLALKVVTALGFNPCSGSNVLERLGSPSQLTLVSVTPRLHSLHDQTSSFCG